MTPPEYVQERVFLVLPGNLTDAQKAQAMEWASALGLAPPPTEKSNPAGPTGLPASIKSPASGAAVSGVVTISGRAASTDFDSYRLEFGAGASPSEWAVIAQSTTVVDDGALGMWDTSALAPGQYTLRLVVKDRARGELIALVTVTVSMKPTAGPTPTPNKHPTPTSTPTKHP
jgi:hypothetical protein